MNSTTNDDCQKLPKTAREFLRRDPGAQARIARRLRVNRSTVCRVLAGKKTSQRVAQAIVREISRLARLYGAAAILVDVESVQR
jgi:hypothetical protein